MPIRGFGGPPPRRDRGPGGPPPPRHGGPRRRDDGLFHGVRLFHGPMRFMFFGRPIVLTTGRQVGFLCGIVAFLVMFIASIATFANLGDCKKDRAYYENVIWAYEITDNVLKDANNDNYEMGEILSYNPKKSTFHYKVTINGVSQEFDTIGKYTDFYSNNKYYFYDEINEYYKETSLKSHVNIYVAYTIDAKGNIRAAEDNIYEIYTDGLDIDITEGFLQNIRNEKTYLDSTIKSQTVAAVILVIIDIAIVAIIILAIVKTIKKSKEKEALESAKLKAEVQEAEARAEEAQAQADMKHRYCRYCGVMFGENDTKCPNCGSAHFDIRK